MLLRLALAALGGARAVWAADGMYCDGRGTHRHMTRLTCLRYRVDKHRDSAELCHFDRYN